jgi:hypothetical protein
MNIEMSHAEFLTRLTDCYAEAVEISRKKNTDYAGRERNAFANFQAGETFGLDTKTGILQRMLDKMMRASNLLKADPLVTGESIEDTLADLSNYAQILRIYCEAERKQLKREAMRERQLAMEKSE